MAYTPGTLVSKNASVWEKEMSGHRRHKRDQHATQQLTFATGICCSVAFTEWSELTLSPPFSSASWPLKRAVNGLPPTPTTTMSASSTLPSFSFTAVTCHWFRWTLAIRFRVNIMPSDSELTLWNWICRWFSAHISIGISFEASSNCALHNLDSFVRVVALIEMSDTGGEETGHYKSSDSACKEKFSDCFRFRKYNMPDKFPG